MRTGYEIVSDDEDPPRGNSHSSPSVAKVSHMPVPCIDKFDGQNWEGFASQFHNLADHLGWSDNERLLQLLHHVKDDARQFVFLKCDATVRASFCRLESALRKRFGSSETRSSFVMQLENLKYTPSRDSLAEYCTDIAFLVRKAWPDASDHMRDVMEVEFFIKNINDPGMMRMVGGKIPRDIDEAREFAEQHLQVEEHLRPSRRIARRVAFDDGEDGIVNENRLHEFGTSLQGSIVKEIEAKFDMLADSLKLNSQPNPPTVGFDEPRQIICYNCKRPGHISRHCDKPRQQWGPQQGPQQWGPQQGSQQWGPQQGPQQWRQGPQQQQWRQQQQGTQQPWRNRQKSPQRQQQPAQQSSTQQQQVNHHQSNQQGVASTAGNGQQQQAPSANNNQGNS